MRRSLLIRTPARVVPMAASPAVRLVVVAAALALRRAAAVAVAAVACLVAAGEEVAEEAEVVRAEVAVAATPAARSTP